MKEDISYSEGYTEIIPYREYDLYDVAWHDSMIAGNGHIGVIESCAPLNDNLIYQNVEFVMPSDEPRYVWMIHGIYIIENVLICIVIIRVSS